MRVCACFFLFAIIGCFRFKRSLNYIEIIVIDRASSFAKLRSTNCKLLFSETLIFAVLWEFLQFCENSQTEKVSIIYRQVINNLLIIIEIDLQINNSLMKNSHVCTKGHSTLLRLFIKNNIPHATFHISFIRFFNHSMLTVLF